MLDYITKLNVKDIAYNLHDQRIGVGASGGMVFQTSAYIGSESENKKLITASEIPTYKYASSTSTATAGMVPSITSAISNASNVFLNAAGKWTKPTGLTANVSAATSSNFGGVKLGFTNATVTNESSQYVAFNDALKLSDEDRAYVPLPIYGPGNLTTDGKYFQHGLVPRINVSTTSARSKQHLTAMGWTTYTVSGTTLILDYNE